jgi:hypothetical protein
MSWRYWVKIEGATESTFQPANTLAVELPIFGIHPSYSVESSNEVSMSGNEIGQRRIRVSLELECVPVSTWDSGTINTDNVQYLLQVILQKPYTRIVAPTTAGYNLPTRFQSTSSFTYTKALIPFVFARCDFSNEKQWASGLEKFTITCYRKELI